MNCCMSTEIFNAFVLQTQIRGGCGDTVSPLQIRRQVVWSPVHIAKILNPQFPLHILSLEGECITPE